MGCAVRLRWFQNIPRVSTRLYPAGGSNPIFAAEFKPNPGDQSWVVQNDYGGSRIFLVRVVP